MTRSLAALIVAALALSACGPLAAESIDPAAIPSGSITADDATGPVVELGSGVSAGVGWRYAMYPVGDDWCTLLEATNQSAGTCGEIAPPDGAFFGSVSQDSLSGLGVSTVDGVVAPDVVSVWVVMDEVDRVPATMMPLDEAGLSGSAFVGMVPDGRTITHLLAVAENGEVLETYELP